MSSSRAGDATTTTSLDGVSATPGELPLFEMDDPPDTTLPREEVPTGLRIAGIVLRSIFLCALLVLTVRVSLPQNESIWSIYETFGDLVRVALGFIVCVWILFHLFKLPTRVS
jgi:hypothetical protein